MRRNPSESAREAASDALVAAKAALESSKAFLGKISSDKANDSVYSKVVSNLSREALVELVGVTKVQAYERGPVEASRSNDDDIDSMGIKALKNFIASRGFSHADCLDKNDLRNRARQVLARGGRTSVSSRLPQTPSDQAEIEVESTNSFEDDFSTDLSDGEDYEAPSADELETLIKEDAAESTAKNPLFAAKQSFRYGHNHAGDSPFAPAPEVIKIENKKGHLNMRRLDSEHSKPGRFAKMWKPQYFMLHENYLLFSKTETSTIWTGTLQLDDVGVRCEAKISNESPSGYEIVVDAPGRYAYEDSRTWRMAPNNAEESMKWISAINNNIRVFQAAKESMAHAMLSPPDVDSRFGRQNSALGGFGSGSSENAGPNRTSMGSGRNSGFFSTNNNQVPQGGRDDRLATSGLRKRDFSKAHTDVAAFSKGPPSFYEILDVGPAASFRVVQSAFRQLNKDYNPSKGHYDVDLDTFKEVQKAYKWLRTTERRTRYDVFLKTIKALRRGLILTLLDLPALHSDAEMEMEDLYKREESEEIVTPAHAVKKPRTEIAFFVDAMLETLVWQPSEKGSMLANDYASVFVEQIHFVFRGNDGGGKLKIPDSDVDKAIVLRGDDDLWCGDLVLVCDSEAARESLFCCFTVLKAIDDSEFESRDLNKSVAYFEDSSSDEDSDVEEEPQQQSD